ncbi:MAG: beta-ketoacyl-[acyl-carrier-protein] synthase family protein [Verrucomicrobiota bacterium JB022]|nr:beta-ketoacyl-[acyl-carrier-protein] synthase family protein [Verrucomicrobiota bacterium JB022]
MTSFQWPHRPVITGLGFISSIGNDAPTVLEALRTQRSGVERFQFLPEDTAPVKVVGTVKEFDLYSDTWTLWKVPERFAVRREFLRSLPPHGVYAVCALNEALADAGLQPEDLADDQTALFAASAGSPFLMHQNLNLMYQTKGRRGNPLGVVSSVSGTLNFNLGAYFGFRGSNLGFVSACTSSTHAIGYAIDAIRMGRSKRVVVVGAEDCTADSILPFAAMRALSQKLDSTASRPWDKSRDGFVGTGGAAVVIIEAADEAQARGAKPYAELLGWGQTADGYSLAAPAPDGLHLARAMQLALDDAKTSLADVSWIHAHATSTPTGDIAEAKAIERLLADGPPCPPVVSTKGLTGHGLSMAGAFEVGMCALTMRHRLRPGNAHLNEVDPDCAALNLPREPEEAESRVILKNNCGFGGSNVSIVLGAPVL